jgi:polysaccharide biosynthesis/export protein
MNKFEGYLFQNRRIYQGVLVLCLCLTGFRADVKGQQPSTSGGGLAGSNTKTDDRYPIGPGDVLDIRVFNRPQLSRDGVRVDGRGMIRMPLIEDEIKAACLTEVELAKEIASRYLKYQRNPQVDVFIKDYQSRPVALIGAVNAPGRFQLQRRMRLLELLTYVGGATDKAGRTIQVIHSTDTSSICVPTSDIPDQGTGLITYKLKDTLEGTEQANPFVQPGDVINVPEADQIYVIGNVVKPSILPLKEPITVSRAIAMSGGTMPDTKSDQIRIVRQVPGSLTKTELLVSLPAINKRQAEDIVLQPNDIVEVPTSSGKRLLRSLMGAIVPSIAQLPVRVVP